MPSYQDYYNRNLGASRMNGAGFQRYQAQPGVNGPRAGLGVDMARNPGSMPMYGNGFGAPGHGPFLIPGTPQPQGTPQLRQLGMRDVGPRMQRGAGGGIDNLFNTLLMQQLGGGMGGQFGGGNIVPYYGSQQQFQRSPMPFIPASPYAPTYR